MFDWITSDDPVWTAVVGGAVILLTFLSSLGAAKNEREVSMFAIATTLLTLPAAAQQSNVAAIRS